MGRRVATYHCQRCGDSFERPPSNTRPPKFCSRECNTKFQAEQLGSAHFVELGRQANTRRRGKIKHGIYRYNKQGCRCDICKAAAKIYRDRNRNPLPPKHGVRRYRKHGCRCEVCIAAEARSYAKQQAKWARSGQRLVEETAPQALRHGYQWTGPELEIAAREGLTAIQAAQILNRTAYAVKHKRRALKVDPRMISLAGLSRRKAF